MVSEAKRVHNGSNKTLVTYPAGVLLCMLPSIHLFPENRAICVPSGSRGRLEVSRASRLARATTSTYYNVSSRSWMQNKVRLFQTTPLARLRCCQSSTGDGRGFQPASSFGLAHGDERPRFQVVRNCEVAVCSTAGRRRASWRLCCLERAPADVSRIREASLGGPRESEKVGQDFPMSRTVWVRRSQHRPAPPIDARRICAVEGAERHRGISGSHSTPAPSPSYKTRAPAGRTLKLSWAPAWVT